MNGAIITPRCFSFTSISNQADVIKLKIIYVAIQLFITLFIDESIKTANGKTNQRSELMLLRLPVFLLLLFLLAVPGIALAKPISESSLEVSLRIGTNYGVGTNTFNHERSKRNNEIVVLSSRVLKTPARYMRRVQYSESHIAVEGLDNKNNILYRDALIDPRLIRSEATDNPKVLRRNDFYRMAANLTVVLPNDIRIVKLRLSTPQWNGMNFDLESMLLIDVRKLR